MSEIRVVKWRHASGIKDGKPWHSLFLEIEGEKEALPWFSGEHEVDAKKELLDQQAQTGLPVTCEASLMVYPDGRRRIEDFEILLPSGHKVDASVMAGKAAEATPKTETTIPPKDVSPPSAAPTATPVDDYYIETLRRSRQIVIKAARVKSEWLGALREDVLAMYTVAVFEKLARPEYFLKQDEAQRQTFSPSWVRKTEETAKKALKRN